MKTIRVAGGLVALFLSGGLVSAQTLSLGSSSWGAGGTFSGSSAAGTLLVGGVTPSGAYFGTNNPDANTFLFGLVNTMSPSGAVGDYNLSGTSVTAGTSLTLTFTGMSAAPRYIAMTGGALTAYSYNAGTLTLTTSTINPVASASDSGGTTLGSAFGLMVVTGGAFDFSGTVFQTDMYWGDILGMQSYPGTMPFAGVNANGVNGQAITFSAYLPVSFLNANGINQPSDATALVQKAGTQAPLGITATYYGPSDPGFSGGGYTYGGASTFDFAGGGADAYVRAAYTNSSWSQGNIGLTAVPEPSTVVTAFGAVALMAALRRRGVTSAGLR